MSFEHRGRLKGGITSSLWTVANTLPEDVRQDVRRAVGWNRDRIGGSVVNVSTSLCWLMSAQVLRHLLRGVHPQRLVMPRATRHVEFTMDYDTNRFRVLRLPNLMLVHWLVNPGVAFNELILGQRIPRTMLVEKRIEEGAVRRSFVPCGECGRIHDGMLWGGRNAFGHWLGYFCPDCGAKIPCLWNLASLVILAVTVPVWILPVVILRDRWIRFERARLQRRRDRLPVMQGPEVFVQAGVFFGVLTGLAMVLLEVVKPGGIKSASHLATVGLSGAMLCGPLFGAGMWFILGRADKSARERGSKVGSGR